MKKTLEINPDGMSSEGILATIEYQDRSLNLTLTTTCYGSHSTTLFINFDNPKNMIIFADALKNIAEHASIDLDK